MKRTPLKRSKGTVIPPRMKHYVMHRDWGCVALLGGITGNAGDCNGAYDADHVRASGGLGMKSVTCPCNLVILCRTHHREKTENGKAWRPPLLAYLEQFDYGPHVEGHVKW